MCSHHCSECGNQVRVEQPYAEETYECVDGETYTFGEWLRAAGRESSPEDLRAAWVAGEDPAEYSEAQSEDCSWTEFVDISVYTSIATPSLCLPDIEGALDLDVTIDCGGDWTAEGEVTMVPSGDGYRAYGDSPDHWVSSDLLAAMREHFGEGERLTEALTELSSAASEACDPDEVASRKRLVS